MTTRYRHTQIGYVLIVALSVTMALLLGILFFIYQQMSQDFDSPPMPGIFASLLITFLFILVVLVVCAVLFATLTVQVNAEAVEIRFGPGVIRKRFPLKDINACRSVVNPWYYGWGIHGIPRGWVYNVSGFLAAEIEMKDGKLNRIGTDDPEGLVKAIQDGLAGRVL